MQGSFAAAQLCTAMLWGRFSDRGGRKRILLIGLSGTTISCLGFGFSRNFYQALMCRMLGGALNGNVGVMRTMISEIVREKKFQSRAFLILPMVANIGSIIGPMIGGITSDPAGNVPEIFGGNWFLEKFPYAPPNLISAIFLSCAAMAVFLGLEEVRFSTNTIYNVLTKSRHTKVMLTRKISVLRSAAKSFQPSAASSEVRRKATNHLQLRNPSVPTATLSNMIPTPNHENGLHHATRTNFPSVASLLTTS